jgi:oligo-1,6-glucosidase
VEHLVTAALGSPPAEDRASAGRWWRKAVVYQIYPRSFADSNGDGIGDLRGIIGRLDYLRALGVDAIWLSPIYRSPQDDNGYDISDYRDVDPIFGTLADFDELLAEAHRRDLKVIMDVVVNHTSDEHHWFRESRSSRDNPKRDWYIWRPEPNNWASFFSGSAWHFDEATGEYYLHLFGAKQPDLNWDNPEVRAAVHAMMRWWLDRGVDGFRLDVINMISKDPALPDGDRVEGSPYGDGGPHFRYGPRLHAYLAEMRDAVTEGRDEPLLFIGETPGATVGQAARLTDPTARELDMVFQFEHVEVDQDGHRFAVLPFRLPALKQSLARWQEGLAEGGWNSLYLSNHDQPRPVSRFGAPAHLRATAAKAIGTVLHLHRGTPFIYQGEELGMTNAPFTSTGDYRDIESLNYYRDAVAAGADESEVLAALAVMSRDHARTPMAWGPGPNGDFTTGTPWIAVNPDYERVNAAAAMSDPASVFHHYRRLIELRKNEPAITDGAFSLLWPDDPALWAFLRATPSTVLLTIANFGAAPRIPTWSEWSAWSKEELLISNHRDDTPALRPWEARVYRRRTF